MFATASAQIYVARPLGFCCPCCLSGLLGTHALPRPCVAAPAWLPLTGCSSQAGHVYHAPQLSLTRSPSGCALCSLRRSTLGQAAACSCCGRVSECQGAWWPQICRKTTLCWLHSQRCCGGQGQALLTFRCRAQLRRLLGRHSSHSSRSSSSSRNSSRCCRSGSWRHSRYSWVHNSSSSSIRRSRGLSTLWRSCCGSLVKLSRLEHRLRRRRH